MTAQLRILAQSVQQRIRELQRQIHDAKRQGDLDYAKELQEELQQLKDQS